MALNGAERRNRSALFHGQTGHLPVMQHRYIDSQAMQANQAPPRLIGLHGAKPPCIFAPYVP